MPKIKTFKTCNDFCKEIRPLVENKNRHSWVLRYAEKLGFLEVEKIDSWSITYRLKKGIQPTRDDARKVAEAINSL